MTYSFSFFVLKIKISEDRILPVMIVYFRRLYLSEKRESLVFSESCQSWEGIMIITNPSYLCHPRKNWEKSSMFLRYERFKDFANFIGRRSLSVWYYLVSIKDCSWFNKMEKFGDSLCGEIKPKIPVPTSDFSSF